MNYYGPREIQRDGKGIGLFHYTCRNDDRIWAVGPCSSRTECPDCKHLKFFSTEQRACKTCSGSGLVAVPDPCPGHPTREEACEHYRQHLLSQMVIHGPKTEQWPKHKCGRPDCTDEATHLIDIPGEIRSYEVCITHANRETLEMLMPAIGEMISSY